MKLKLQILTFFFFSTLFNLNAKNLLVENKSGASFEGTFDEILPDTPSGPAIKITRKSDRKTFRVPLSTLSEKTLIQIVLLQNKKETDGNDPFGNGTKPSNEAEEPNSQRVDGYKFVESDEATAEDIDLNIEFESVKKDGRSMTILGKIKNNSSKIFEYCKIQVELRDGSKKLIARDDTYTDPSDIKSGQISTFEIFILEDAIEDERIREIIYRVKGDIGD